MTNEEHQKNLEIMAKHLGITVEQLTGETEDTRRKEFERRKALAEDESVVVEPIRLDFFDPVKQGVIFPARPEEGIYITLIGRGSHKGKGYNAQYARPGRGIRCGNK